MKFSSIASGSKGNCLLYENNDVKLLVDAGISKKRIEEGMSEYGSSLEEVNGILITHEHSDHISGLGVVSRKYHIPIYATKGTISKILEDSKVGTIDRNLFNEIEENKDFYMGSTLVTPFSISHDAAQPVAYRFDSDGKSMAVATDMGMYDDYIIGNLKGLDAVLIESNHDINMLQIGPYPYTLKRRIWGNKGHLSNETCGNLLNEIISDRLKKVILGHLSKENNLPELAYETIRNEINMADGNYCADDISIQVASRTEPSCHIEF